MLMKVVTSVNLFKVTVLTKKPLTERLFLQRFPDRSLPAVPADPDT